MKIIMALFICLIANCSMADSLYTGAWSYHPIPDKDVDHSSHNLIGYEHNTLLVAAYKNSYGKASLFVAKRLEFIDEPTWKAAVNVGINYGYYKCLRVDMEEKTWCPAVVPEISYTKYKVQPTLSLFGKAIVLAFKWEI